MDEELLRLLLDGPDCELDASVQTKLLEMKTPEDLKTILDDCARYSLASDFTMLVLDGEYQRWKGKTKMAEEFIDILFDGGPSHHGGRFMEVENPKGESIKVGEWISPEGGSVWRLRIPDLRAEVDQLKDEIKQLKFDHWLENEGATVLSEMFQERTNRQEDWVQFQENHRDELEVAFGERENNG